MTNPPIPIRSVVTWRHDRVVADGYNRELAAIRRVMRFGVLRRYARKPRPTGLLARWRWARRINREVDQIIAQLDNLPPSDALYAARPNAAISKTGHVDRS